MRNPTVSNEIQWDFTFVVITLCHVKTHIFLSGNILSISHIISVISIEKSARFYSLRADKIK